MADITLIILSVIYTVLVLIVVSLDGTYNLTHTLFGGLIGNQSQAEYGIGVKFTSPGFIIHIIIFTLLILMPMMTCN